MLTSYVNMHIQKCIICPVFNYKYGKGTSRKFAEQVLELKYKESLHAILAITIWDTDWWLMTKDLY